MADFTQLVYHVDLSDGAWSVTLGGTVEFHVDVTIPGAVGNALPAGGTTGQLLAKHTDVYYDTEWVDPTPTLVGLSEVTNDAQLKRSADDWAGFASVTPAATDALLIEDASDGGAKKRVLIEDLPIPGADVIPNNYFGWEIINPDPADGDTVLGALKSVDTTLTLWNLHMVNVDNPHGVTKSQVGLGNVPNLDTTAAVAASHTHANSAQLALVTDGDHDVRTDNPHGVTKTQVGLSNVPNLDTTAAIAASHTHTNSAQLALVSDGDHDVRTDNPHATTASQVGLGNVPNLDTTNAVNNQHTHANSAQLALVTDGDHDVRTDNPHAVTASQVGLGNVTNAAQLTRGAGDWTGFTALTTLADDDVLLVEDTSDSSGAKKKVTVADARKGTPEAIAICFDGGGATLTVDKKLDLVAKCGMTITGWTLLADQSGSVAIGVWKDTYANYPPTVADVLVTPSITTAVKNQATGLSLSVAAGETIRFNVNSVTTIQRVTLVLTGVRA